MGTPLGFELAHELMGEGKGVGFEGDGWGTQVAISIIIIITIFDGYTELLSFHFYYIR
jgi:hypothetical protein